MHPANLRWTPRESRDADGAHTDRYVLNIKFYKIYKKRWYAVM